MSRGSDGQTNEMVQPWRCFAGVRAEADRVAQLIDGAAPAVNEGNAADEGEDDLPHKERSPSKSPPQALQIRPSRNPSMVKSEKSGPHQRTSVPHQREQPERDYTTRPLETMSTCATSVVSVHGAASVVRPPSRTASLSSLAKLPPRPIPPPPAPIPAPPAREGGARNAMDMAPPAWQPPASHSRAPSVKSENLAATRSAGYSPARPQERRHSRSRSARRNCDHSRGERARLPPAAKWSAPADDDNRSRYQAPGAPGRSAPADDGANDVVKNFFLHYDKEQEQTWPLRFNLCQRYVSKDTCTWDFLAVVMTETMHMQVIFVDDDCDGERPTSIRSLLSALANASKVAQADDECEEDLFEDYGEGGSLMQAFHDGKTNRVVCQK